MFCPNKKRYFECFMCLDVAAIEVPQGAVLLLGSLPVKINKRLARDVLSPRNLTLFMTSPTQTAGHKVAAYADMFSRLSNVDF